MGGKKGYAAVPRMRGRAVARRGGNERPDDELDRKAETLAAHVETYLDWLRMHNRTENGVRSKWNELKPFLAWAAERDLLRPDQMTRSKLESYQRWLYRYRKPNGKPLGNSTQRARLGSLKLFFAWLCKQRHLEANPASELELPRQERRLPVEALERNQIEAVLSVPDIIDPLGLRDRAILELFYSTGIRRTELARLEVTDLKQDRCLLHIRQGKGRKDRMVPVGSRSMRWLERYLNEVRALLLNDLEEKALFLTGYGEGFNVQVLGRIVGKYIQKADIGRTGGPHLFRHTCATHMLEGGADIRYIQQLLGHEKLETTAIYTEVSITQLQAVHARCHPSSGG